MVKTSEGSSVLTLPLAAELLQISKAHLSNVINGKVTGVPKLPFVRVGRRILIKREWVEKWLEQAAGGAYSVNANI